MVEVRGQLLPVYVVVDVSGSMGPHVGELNTGLRSLHEALLGEPMTAAKVRLTILAFSSTATIRLHLADLRGEAGMPQLASGGVTNYAAAFEALLRQIPTDVTTLKNQQYQVHRPVVVLLSDGQPTDAQGQPADPAVWRDAHRRLVDRSANPVAPNIIACGIGQADAR